MGRKCYLLVILLMNYNTSRLKVVLLFLLLLFLGVILKIFLITAQIFKLFLQLI